VMGWGERMSIGGRHRCPMQLPPQHGVGGAQHAEALSLGRSCNRPAGVQHSHSAAVAQAYYAIAECHEALGSIDDSIVALETYMDLTRLASPLTHGRACCKFGVLYYNLGKFPQARLPHKRCCNCLFADKYPPSVRSSRRGPCSVSLSMLRRHTVLVVAWLQATACARNLLTRLTGGHVL
jgi:hypothetical protein